MWGFDLFKSKFEAVENLARHNHTKNRILKTRLISRGFYKEKTHSFNLSILIIKKMTSPTSRKLNNNYYEKKKEKGI